MAIERDPIEVTVEIDGEELIAGTLRIHERRTQSASFAYADTYLADPRSYERDPALTLDASPVQTPPGKEMFNAFSDGAPDRWGRSLMQREERDRVRWTSTRPRSLTTADFLLGTRDELRQGAIRLRRPGAGNYWSDSDAAVPQLLFLAKLLAATDEFLAGETDGDWQAIKDLVDAGSSLGGARPKAAVRTAEGELAFAKFPRKLSDEWDVASWEKLESDLAARCGITVARSDLEKVAGRPVLIVRRFDRDGRRRVGFASALTMLEGTDLEQRSYLEIAEVLAASSDHPNRDLEELFRRIVFSVLTSNTDDHLRNHGFLRRGRGWELSPAYDLNPNPDSPGRLSTAIGVDDARADLGLCLEVSPDFRLSLPAAKAIIVETATATATWRAEAIRRGLPKREIERMAGAFETRQRPLVGQLTSK